MIRLDLLSAAVIAIIPLTYLLGVRSIALLLLATLPPLATAVPVLFLIMACLGTGNGSVFQLVPQRFGKEIGVATGLVGAAGGLGGFFLPTILGGLKGIEGSYAAGLLLFALIAASAITALLRVRQTRRATWASAELEAVF